MVLLESRWQWGLERLKILSVGVVPNVEGRVLTSADQMDTKTEQVLYVVGWLKRGPTGIVGTNLYCAKETVASILEDVKNGKLIPASKPSRKGLQQILEEKGIKFVPFSGWERIDLKEKMAGQLKNKPREKTTNWNDLLQVAIG